ncbi:MAG: DUF4282 domain-containing protein [Actinobacteria bacterium]|nr:DUF4282 domain-containing protein [Actinomycetota bacterium]
MEQRRGFWEALFDFTFTNFVALMIIRVLYWISIIVAFIFAIGVIVTGFSRSAGAGLLSIVLAIIVFFLSIIVARLYLELIAVVFRIEVHTRKIAEQDQVHPGSAP